MKKFFKTLKNFHPSQKGSVVIGLGIILILTIAYGLLVLNRYWQFEYFFKDNVYFHSALWKISQLQAPMVNHEVMGRINIFGDHFHPTIILFAIPYVFSKFHEFVLLEMCIFLGLGGLFAMLVGMKIVKSRLTVIALVIGYFLYLGTQNAMIFGFHEVNLIPFFFFLMLFGLFYKNNFVYWAGFILFLLTKETTPIVLVCMGLFYIFALKDRRRGAMTIIISVIYYLLVTKYVIPGISGNFLYGQISLPGNRFDLFNKLFLPTEKIETFIISMATFGFLPLLNVFTLPLVLQDFLVRYLFSLGGNVQYRLAYHYNLALVPLLIFSSFWSVRLLETKKRLRRFIPFLGVGVIVCTLLIFRFYKERGPLLLTVNPAFYENTGKNKFLWKLVDHVPETGVVMTQNHLGMSLSTREVHMMTDKIKQLCKITPDYVVVDLRDEQNPNNYFPLTKERTREVFTSLLEKEFYKVSYNEDKMFVLTRIPTGFGWSLCTLGQEGDL